MFTHQLIEGLEMNHQKSLSEVYITDEEVTAHQDELGLRASHNANDWEEFGSAQFDTVREILEEQHAARLYEIYLEGLEFFADETECEEIVQLLMKGMTTDLHIDDELIVLDGVAFFGEWEIKRLDDGQWQFEHSFREGGDFLDIDVLAGLQVCEELDSEYSSQLLDFGRIEKARNFNHVDKVKLNNLLAAAKQQGVIEGLTRAHEPMLRDWDQQQQVN